MHCTAAGSLPGVDFRGAVRAMSEALPDVLPLPELPGRGPESGMVGRALGLVEGLAFELNPDGWRLVSSSAAEHRRARARWRSDLDDVEELLQGFSGVLKVGVAGPWTLATAVHLPRGERVLADAGARRDLAQALQDGVAQLWTELTRRLPQAELLLQVDEPSLVGVAAGGIPTGSGLYRHPAVPVPELADALAPLAPDALIHCCADGPWLEVASAAGFRGISVNSRLFHTPAHLDALTPWLEGERVVLLGVVDTTTGGEQPVDALVTEALRVLRPLEVAADTVSRHVMLGTACGLAEWTPADVTAQLKALQEATRLVPERLT